MVVDSDGDNLLSVLLTDDILVKLLLNLVRCRNILEVDERNLLLTLLLFLIFCFCGISPIKSDIFMKWIPGISFESFIISS